MDGYAAPTYGDAIAERYDALYDPLEDTGPIASALNELADGGPALELGIGTGRLALPLAALGTAVSGVDASPAMVERLRAKPGGDAIAVTMGDFGDPDTVVAADGPFTLVYVVFNTFFALLTPEAQQACFRAAFTVLAPGGRFLIEAFVPDLGRFDRNQRTATSFVGLSEVHLESATHDVSTQRVDSAHIIVGAGGTKLYPVSLRYAWASELDLMGAAAGFAHEHRWGGWDRSAFGRNSTKHVSVWRKPLDANAPIRHPSAALRDDTVVLRPLVAADAPDLVAAATDPDIVRWTYLAEGLTTDGAHQLVRRSENHRRSGFLIRFVIADAADGRFLGTIGVRPGEGGRGETFYWLAPAARGRGAATRALNLLSSWAFASLGLARLHALVIDGNAASERVLGRAGYVNEGLLRSYEPVQGVRPDMTIWSRLPD